MKVTIDQKAGFCWGVVRTVDIAEDTLANQSDEDVYVLGHIIHNPREIERLENKGLRTISHDDFEEIAANGRKTKVIIRAHGEPPSTFVRAEQLGIELVDATCPLVTNLQNRVKKYYDADFQIVIYGKKEHAEVIGLRGVCNDEAIVIRSLEEAKEIIDFSRKTALISQTTMPRPVFYEIKEYLDSQIGELIHAGEINDKLLARDTTCRAVTGREEPLIEYAKSNDVIIFVSGKNSSNGKSLYHKCKEYNPNTHFVEDIDEIDWNWFEGAKTVGISGATSTPQWYMRKVKETIENRFNISEN
jgi:4-hydroxy-3-methylbut-2-enyl diphosphate reductase